MLADFVAERSVAQSPRLEEELWILETDGSSRAKRGGVGIELRSPDGSINAQVVTLAYVVSNNEAEYEAVLLGLRVARQLSLTSIELKWDSQLVSA